MSGKKKREREMGGMSGNKRKRERETEEGREFYRLPEDCISHVISLTSPGDSGRSAVVSTTFRSAAESETVWERFLPPDYQEILSRAVDPVDFSSKRDLYFRLVDSVLIDGGKMSFALERSTGRRCYTLSARELGIIWGDHPQYWRWIPDSNSRFSEVAELLNVCWLDIHGWINCKILSPRTAYAAYLIFKTVHGLHGLSFPKQVASVSVGAHVSEHTVCLQPDEVETLEAFGAPQLGEEIGEDVRAPHGRDDGWMEMELGEFFNDNGEDGLVFMRLMEVRGGNWKSGLIIQGIEVRPKK